MKRFNILLATAAFLGCVGISGAAPLEVDYQHSKVNVDVHATIDSFVGQLDKYTATVDCEPSTNLPAKAAVSFDFKDLKTGKTDRDAEMLKWLDYSNNPTATFALEGWKQDGTTNLALGDLTIHGVKKAIQMPVTIQHNGADWDIAGEADFDYRDFNLPKIRKMLMLVVNPHLKVTFHLVGKIPATVAAK